MIGNDQLEIRWILALENNMDADFIGCTPGGRAVIVWCWSARVKIKITMKRDEYFS